MAGFLDKLKSGFSGGLDVVTDAFSSILEQLGWLPPDAKILFLGLDCAGKTTLMGMLRDDKMSAHVPTLHPGKQEVFIGRRKFSAFDMGGHETARRLWKDYFANVDCILFIVDAADRSRLGEAKFELGRLLDNESLKYVPVVVLGNKVDVPTACSEDELKNALQIPVGGAVSLYGNPNQYPAQGGQFGAPQGNQFGAPQGNQFGAPQGNQFGAPQGNQFGAPQGNGFQNPNDQFQNGGGYGAPNQAYGAGPSNNGFMQPPAQAKSEDSSWLSFLPKNPFSSGPTGNVECRPGGGPIGVFMISLKYKMGYSDVFAWVGNAIKYTQKMEKMAR